MMSSIYGKMSPNSLFLRLFFMCIFSGQNPLHILAQYAKDNAVAIFELFRQSMPDYPINALDADENIGKGHQLSV